MKIFILLFFLLFQTVLVTAQETLIGKWTAHSVIFRNAEIELNKKEKIIFKKDSTYIRRYSLYKSKADTSNHVLFSTTFFNGKTTTVVKDMNGNVVKPRSIKESGKFNVDLTTKTIIFTKKDQSYRKNYKLDRRTLLLEESTDGILKTTETVYLLKLRKRR
ncbi:hypothetical protein [Pseudochryseolinea flava]|uniref:Uncharacterized protein n=1 Tax=Pseudochryseolinea flava TaxID=2059302 RepID=A0A364Y3J3_9BACT|nr:hypothetical protein [Pseudochryseolinea flava]RAW00914.1 hypothetical protein DQQ10_11770 [Pseudochryseolinea flava]